MHRRPNATVIMKRTTEPVEGRDHYSYRVYANRGTARTFDERRFGGPIGELLAGTQEQVLANFIGRIQDRPIQIGRASCRERVYVLV